MRTRAASNLPKVGRYNRGVVLEAVRRAGAAGRSPRGISRVEIAQRTGLTAQAVSGIVRQLLTDGMITESGVESVRMGKPRQLLQVNPRAGYAAGMHFDPGEVTCAVVDFAGHPVALSHEPVPGPLSPEAAVLLMADCLRDTLARSGLDRAALLGMGLAAPGPIDSAQQHISAPTKLTSWPDSPLASMLADATGVPTALSNDATAAVIGECWAGSTQFASDVGYFYFGTGIGGGLVLRDDLYDGFSRNAAEFGHIIVDPSGPECYCGNRGCVEALCRPAALVQRARAGIAAGRRSSLRGDTSTDLAYEALCAAARDGDSLAVAVIGAAAGTIATAAVTLVNVLDLEVIVLGGRGLRHVGEMFRDEVADALTTRPLARGPHTTRVELSSVGEDAAAIGAATMIFHSSFSATTSILLAGSAQY